MLFKCMESAHDRFISVWVLPHLWVPESLEYQQLFYWIQAILESRHVAAFTKKWIQSSCEQSSQFSHRIFSLTLDKIVFHCTAPSRSRSSWSWCLPILITIFELCDDKESGLFERTAGIVTPFLSCIVTSFFVQIFVPVSRVQKFTIVKGTMDTESFLYAPYPRSRAG